MIVLHASPCAAMLQGSKVTGHTVKCNAPGHSVPQGLDRWHSRGDESARRHLIILHASACVANAPGLVVSALAVLLVPILGSDSGIRCIFFCKVHFSDSVTSIRALSVAADGVHSPRTGADSVHTWLLSGSPVLSAALWNGAAHRIAAAPWRQCRALLDPSNRCPWLLLLLLPPS